MAGRGLAGHASQHLPQDQGTTPLAHLGHTEGTPIVGGVGPRPEAGGASDFTPSLPRSRWAPCGGSSNAAMALRVPAPASSRAPELQLAVPSARRLAVT